jgi:hypothetical protein
MPSGIIINYYLGDHGVVTTTPGYRMLMGVGRIIIYYILPNLIHYAISTPSITKLFV